MSIDRPACCTEQAFKLWVISARLTGNVKSFCVDCMPSHKAKMCVAGKCNAQETKFREDDDGFVEGYQPKVEEKPAKKARVYSQALIEAKQAHMLHIRQMRDEHNRMQAEINEQKILLALHTGPATAKIIERKTGIKESTVYRYLGILVDKRQVFCDKVPGRPKLFRIGVLA